MSTELKSKIVWRNDMPPPYRDFFNRANEDPLYNLYWVRIPEWTDLNPITWYGSTLKVLNNRCHVNVSEDGWTDGGAYWNRIFSNNQYSQARIHLGDGWVEPEFRQASVITRFNPSTRSLYATSIWLSEIDGTPEIGIYRISETEDFYQLASDINIEGDWIDDKILRLESNGINHKVYYNGILYFNVNDSAYTEGKPAIGIWDSHIDGETFTSANIIDWEGGNL